MKNYHKKGIALLCLSLLLTLQPTLVSGKDEEEVNPTKKLFDDLIKFFKAKLEKLKPEFNVIAEDTHVEYDMPDKKAKVVIQLSSTQINVTLTNEYETQELEFDNVDFSEEKEFLEENYIDKFLGHLDQIKGDLKAMFPPIVAGLQAASHKGFFGETKLAKVKEGKGGNEDLLVFEMEYGNGEIVMRDDKIVGELIRDNGEYFMRVVTKFFQKSFQLAVVTDSYLEGEAKKLGSRVLEHLDSMYYLNEDPDRAIDLKSFHFSEYMDQLKNLIKPYVGEGDGNSVDVQENEFTITMDDTLVVSGTVSDPMANMVSFTVINIKMEALGGSEYTVVIPKKSIYNMKAMVDKFMLELMQNLKYSRSKITPEESVGVFK